jgi:hypothetical protein
LGGFYAMKPTIFYNPSMKNITLQYKKIIDRNSTKTWDKQVWNDAFLEYRMKSQFYDEEVKFPLFKDLIVAKPEAKKLHYLTSLACMTDIQRLQNLFPDIVDNLGKRSVPFVQYDFKIITSDFNHKDSFVIQLDFVSTPLKYIETIGDSLWIGLPDSISDKKIDTVMIKLQPNLMINTMVYETP